MSLTPGTRIGVYEVIEKIGAGGMGEVYRAHDARLRRDVAVKVLPADVAADPDRLRRFEQEALSTAALNHPNILAVYDIGRDADQAFVVAELLDGQTLREAVAAGSLPVRKVVDYAIQVTQGLAAAHEKGIVHRDLKPENLFVTADERLKILDFGLAKVADTRQSGASTVLAAATEPGMVLGTIGYMAPEQVRGVAVDHRADLFSFGAVLYEMLAGRRAFVGETAADTMTAILKESTVPLEDSGRPIPPGLARVVERCLEKQPSRRFQSASDLAFALQTLSAGTSSGSAVAVGAIVADSASQRGRAKRWVTASLGLAAVVLAGLGIMPWLRPAPPAAPFFILDIAPPLGHTMGLKSALSPDGSKLVYDVRDAQQRERLWLRTLATGESHPLDGTDGGSSPFWSPDGNAIGFFANRRLLVLDLQTGKLRVVCDADGARVAGTWNAQDVILFSREADTPVMRVDARRVGAAVALSHARGVRPRFLPDGRHFLYTTPIRVSDRGTVSRTIRVGDLESDQTKLLTGGRDAAYAAGLLLLVRRNSLVAQPFDPDTRVLSGTPRVLIEDMGYFPGDTGPNYSVAGDRLFAFRREPERNRQLVWYTRDGQRAGVVDEPGSWRNPELSPDDTHVAAQRNDGQGLREDIWIYDVNRRTSRALLATPNTESSPVWSADGTRVIARTLELGASATDAGTAKLVEKSLESGAEKIVAVLKPSAGETFQALTSDGKSALSFRMHEGSRDIIVTPLDGANPDTTFAKTSFDETQPALSPDERWLAYVSNELGQRHVFIQPFPAGGLRILVTKGSAGGVQPRWSRDGRELYYLARDGTLTVVATAVSGDRLQLGPARSLFRTTMDFESGLGTRADYAVTRDGHRFIVAEPRAETEAAGLTVLVNWMSGLVARPGVDR